MTYKCTECAFTGEGWHRWNCSKGRLKVTLNQDFTSVLDHFDKVMTEAFNSKPEMLPVIKDDK